MTAIGSLNDNIKLRKKRNKDQWGEKNHMWKGGWYFDDKGYMHVKMWSHLFHDCEGYVPAHRLVMEEYLGRYLTKKEQIHHLDLNKGNNRIGNLMLFANQSEHFIYERGGTKYGKRVDTTNRYCILCNEKTYIDKKTGWESWFKHEDVFICAKCHYKKRRRKRKLKNS